MADIRINSLPTTASASSSDDFLALDGATNGTRKLNAYSPTFGGNVTASGNLTVSGVTTSAGISNSGALTFTAAIGQVAGSIAKNATYGLTYYGVTGSSNDNTMLNASGAVVLSNPAGTTNATLAGNLTVSGTGTSTFGGTIRAGAGSGETLSAGSLDTAADIGIKSTQGIVQGAARIVTFTNGNVLIGTSTDGGQKLQVSGTSNFSNPGSSTIANFTNSANADFQIVLTASTSAKIGPSTPTSLILQTNGTTALTLDSSQNATFAGTSVTVDGASTGSTLTLKRASNANGAIISYKTTTTSKWYHGLRGLVDDNWYLQNDVAGNTALFFDASTSNATFAGTTVKISNAASPQLNFNNVGVRDWYAGVQTANDRLVFGTSVSSSGGHAIRIDSSLNVYVPNGELVLTNALKLGNAYTAGAPTATGYVTIKDSAGNTYKVFVGT